MSGSIKIPKGEYLFQENDSPDAMYVIKSGKIAIVREKQEKEIVLAELGPGAMLGEMAFFDDKPRSASARAVKDTECIKLPFKALHAQFKNFPEWSKAIMRTVNDHLRKANARIKELEKVNTDDEMFPPHQTNVLLSILCLVGNRYGKTNDDGSVTVPPGKLRNYTIQIFQQPTHKMQKLGEILTELGHVSSKKNDDGTTQFTLLRPEFLFEFIEWHNRYLFQRKEERITILEDEMPVLRALGHFAKTLEPDQDGKVTLSLTHVQNESMRELDYLVKVDHFNFLVGKKLITSPVLGESGVTTTFLKAEIANLLPFWELVYKLKKAQRA